MLWHYWMMINFKNIKFTALVLGIVWSFIIFGENTNQLFVLKFNNWSGEISSIILRMGDGLEALIIVFTPYISLRIYEAFYRNEDK